MNSNGIFRNMYVYANTYMHAIKTDDKRGHKFARKWEKQYGRFWKEEREGKNIIKKKTFGKKKMTLFLNLNIIPLCKQDTFCSYIHDLMEI